MWCFSVLEQTKQPTSIKEQARKFYEDVFKESLCDEVNTKLSEEQKREKVGLQENIDQIILFHTENNGLQQDLMYNLCMIGRSLKRLKEVIGMANKELDSAFKELKGLSKSMRDFYIAYFDFATIYSNLMYVTAPLRDIIRYFKHLKGFITEDEDFWKY